MSNSDDALPLSGLRVLDLTAWWAGPLAAMIMADLGAEVIKVEAIQRPDGWRSTLTDFSLEKWWESSPLFNAINRNKHGLTLNLNVPEGVDLFKQLVAKSDFVFENFSRRVMPKFGLDYQTLKEINPRIIMVSQTGFGQDGPWSDYVSFANVAESLTGIAHLTGHPDGPPCISGQMLGDTLSGVHGAHAALLALSERRRTGEGQYVDLSQLETNLPVVAEALAEQQLNQRSWSRNGNRNPHMAPHGCYPAQEDDQWLVIAVENEEQWQRLANCIAESGDGEWASDDNLASLVGRKTREDELDAALSAWTGRHARDELVAQLRSLDIPAAPVLGPSEMLNEPHLQARGFFEQIDREPVGELPYPISPIRFSKSKFAVRKNAPALGEDNEYVLSTLLGLSRDEIDRLEREQITGTAPAFG